MYVDERESRFRSEIIEFLEEKGYTIEKTEPRSRQEIIDQNLPIKVDLDNRTYAMMGNTTCAAAACSGRALCTGAEFYEDFKRAQNLNIYNDLTQKLLAEFAADGKCNVVFSPMSVIILLAILADAAGGETKAEIMKALGCEDDPQAFMDWLSKIQEELMDSGALVSSNAMCIKEGIKDKITTGYTEHLKEMFGGELFAAKDMAGEVNEWVNKKTKGMIPKIADDHMNTMQACLLNAIAFEAKWEKKYERYEIDLGEFCNSDGTYSEVMTMGSFEWSYIENQHFIGFIKPYRRVGYSYMALLPKEEGSEYFSKAIKQLDLMAMFWKASEEKVLAIIPEHTLEYGKELNDFCKGLGIEKAFSDKADFRTMIDEWLKVEQIIHKAFIQVDRKGTKAVAVSAAECVAGCASVFDYHIVDLNRPFVYAIVHDKTGLPVFTGVVNYLEDSDYRLEDSDQEE